MDASSLPNGGGHPVSPSTTDLEPSSGLHTTVNDSEVGVILDRTPSSTTTFTTSIRVGQKLTRKTSKTSSRHRSATRPTPFPWQRHEDNLATSIQGSFTKFWSKSKRKHQQRVKNYTWLDWLAFFIPCVRWLRTYDIKKYLLADVIAGLSVGFMVVPQSMSYANLAGLPSVYGLYGAFLPVLAYAIVGSSRHLAVGPVAVTSLLISTNLKPLVDGMDQISNPNSPAADQVDAQNEYNHMAIQLSFLVACLYTSVGVFRLGFLTNFLSHSVIGGFTSGAAIIIGLSQFKYIVGYSIKPAHDQLNLIVQEYIDNVRDLKWQEFIMGMTLLALMITMKELGKRVKRLKWLRPLGPITACVISLIAVYVGKLDQHGIRIVQSIPSGLPHPTVSWWAPLPFVRLIPTAILVMLVDLLESTSIARALATKNHYELNANQEIVGLGLANFAGSAFSAYTTTGSFSRSAVNNDSGAKTGLAGFVTGWVVGFVLLFLTPVFEKLPYNVMGAIVVSSVTGLFEPEQAAYLFRVNKLDFLVWMASFLGTLFISVEIGLGISIGLAMVIVIYESAFPHTAMLGRIPGSRVYRNIKQYPEAQMTPGILAVRIDAPIYFANMQWIKDRLDKYQKKATHWSMDHGAELEYIIIDMSPVTHIDASGLHSLEQWIKTFEKNDIQTVLCNPSTKVIKDMELAHIPDLLGREWIFVSVIDAVNYCRQQMQEQGLSADEAEQTMDTESDSSR